MLQKLIQKFLTQNTVKMHELLFKIVKILGRTILHLLKGLKMNCLNPYGVRVPVDTIKVVIYAYTCAAL